MTLAETVVGGIVIASISSMMTSLLTGKNKVSREELEKHKEEKAPHKACPVHETQLNTIDKKIDRIEGKVDELVARKTR